MKKNVIVKSQFDKDRYCRYLSQDISIEQLQMMTQKQYSRNSLLAIRRDWLSFTDYAKLKQRPFLPASVDTVLEFITMMSHKRKFSSLKRYVITISNIHNILSYKDPTSSVQVSLLLNRLKLEKLGDEKQTPSFTLNHLERIRDLLIVDSTPVACRDLAIYSIMFECALKRSEVRELNFSQFTNSSSEDDNIIVQISEKSYQLSCDTSQALNRWFLLLDKLEGPVFRSINRHQQINNAVLNDSSIYRILKKASTMLGLPEHLSFSGQSARVGAVTELFSQGYNIKDIQSFGRWNSPVMPNLYLGKTHLAEQGKLIFKSFNKIN
ncbi:tyrosine-type recombinase/integrase [Vibrio sp. RC27]